MKNNKELIMLIDDILLEYVEDNIIMPYAIHSYIDYSKVKYIIQDYGYVIYIIFFHDIQKNNIVQKIINSVSKRIKYYGYILKCEENNVYGSYHSNRIIVENCQL